MHTFYNHPNYTVNPYCCSGSNQSIKLKIFPFNFHLFYHIIFQCNISYKYKYKKKTWYFQAFFKLFFNFMWNSNSHTILFQIIYMPIVIYYPHNITTSYRICRMYYHLNNWFPQLPFFY